MQSAIAVTTMVRFKDFRHAAADSDIFVCQAHTDPVVEVGAPRQVQLGKQFRHSIDIPKGVNQLCLLPITQDLQIDAQAFF